MSEIPSALNPVAPEIQNLGGQQDVQATMQDLSKPSGQVAYEQAMQQLQLHTPGLPPQELERQAVQNALQYQNVSQAQQLQKQNQVDPNVQRIEQLNADRAKLNMPPLPMPAGAQAPVAPSPLNENDFLPQPQQDVPQPGQPQQAGMPSEFGAITGSYDTQQRATYAIAKANADLAKQRDIEEFELHNKYKEHIAKQEQINADFNRTYSERTRYLENISNELASQDFTAPTIDKDRLWNSRSTGQKVMAGIALFLGAVGGAMSGKDNMAMTVINKAIDADIEEQKYNIAQSQDTKRMKLANLKDQFGNQQTMLANLRAKFGDDIQAESALRGLIYQQAQHKIASYVAKTDSKVVLERAKIIIAQLKAQEQQAAAEFKARVAQQQILANMGSMDPSQITPQMEMLAGKEGGQVLKDVRERGAPGWIGAAPTKEVASKFIEFAKETQPAIDGVNQILAATKKFPTDLSERAKIATDLKILAGKLRLPLQGPGAMTDKDYERLMDTLGNPAALFSMKSVERARLQTVLKNLESSLETNAKASGFRRRPTVNVPMRPYGQ